MTAVLQSAIIDVEREVMNMAKRKYKVTFITGFSMVLLLNQFDLKRIIHNYKVRGYEPLTI